MLPLQYAIVCWFMISMFFKKKINHFYRSCTHVYFSWQNSEKNPMCGNTVWLRNWRWGTSLCLTANHYNKHYCTALPSVFQHQDICRVVRWVNELNVHIKRSEFKLQGYFMYAISRWLFSVYSGLLILKQLPGMPSSPIYCAFHIKVYFNFVNFRFSTTISIWEHTYD